MCELFPYISFLFLLMLLRLTLVHPTPPPLVQQRSDTVTGRSETGNRRTFYRLLVPSALAQKYPALLARKLLTALLTLPPPLTLLIPKTSLHFFSSLCCIATPDHSVLQIPRQQHRTF
uniref:Secreted protein n=1 Tax=Trypanosoma vivax (strain Y486) TaxID=1055687 RepID=G0TZW4_TRYVY|nr:hypothetical protein, unlikely [Trypanosoma vivax Y486]